MAYDNESIHPTQVIGTGSSRICDRMELDSSVLTPAGSSVDEAYSHLPAYQAEILHRQTAVPEPKQGAAVLYRFASRCDVLIIQISVICSIAAGAAMPLMTVLFGNVQNLFQTYLSGNEVYEEFDRSLFNYVMWFIYLGIGEFVLTYISTVGFIYTGEHITGKIRQTYLASCLRQNIAFFDGVGAGEVTVGITSDTNLIQDGISEKVSLSITAFATFLSSFIIGFILHWKLTLILCFILLALILNMGIGGAFVIKYNGQSLDAFTASSDLADEIISSIRTVVALGTQERLAQRYDTYLNRAEYYGFRVKAILAVIVAGMMLILYLNYAVAFWQGCGFLLDSEIELSDLLTILMSIMMGVFSLSSAAPNLRAFSNATTAAARIFSTIDRKSPLDPIDEIGFTIDHFRGNIQLHKIKHIYPSRPKVVVMDNVSLDIPAGRTTALVGTSGSGKSTIISLLERFYDPVEGSIYLDGYDIRTLNLRWLRQQMALISQEPILFDTSIFDNIHYGLTGTEHEHASQEEKHKLILEAAKKANAHDFVSALPQGYETRVGERGSLLSGGQRQRIAIARAIVSDPKILLLDEATSALDTKSEDAVQAALQVAARGRTTIIIAHRLSTIRHAHNIVVMADGCVKEQGNHNDLLEKKGVYFNLISSQNLAAADDGSVHGPMELNPKETSHEKVNSRGGTPGFASRNTQSQEINSDKEYSMWALIKLIASFNAPEWKLMIVGWLFSAICGGGNPTHAVFFAKQIVTLSEPATPETRESISDTSNFWSSMYLMLALIQFVAFLVQGIVFAKCSERMIHRVRHCTFRTILRQNIAFFDQHTTGALTSFITTETTDLAGMSGTTLGTILMMITTLVSASAVSLAVGWRLSLVCMTTIPVLVGCGFFRFWLLAHFQKRSKIAYERSASYASEAISAITTIASLTREQDVLAQYVKSLKLQQEKSLISILGSSGLYAASQSLLFGCSALGFWYGGTLVAHSEYDSFQFFLCFMAILFGAQSAGTFFSFAPDMGKAYEAAIRLKMLFDRQPEIDTWLDSGRKMEGVDGLIQFRDVHFSYPTRPERPVLCGLDLTVQPGQYIALVGASGCGKSTILSLLERLYNPLHGDILVDNTDIRELNINNYRSHIALVSQEPTLYQGTIKDNILFGTADAVSDDMVEFACREANIYEFIVSLPEAFDTIVGNKGTLLSGGQKQRIAIARALIRNSNILLLDEATSALDSESEQTVQEALNKATKGRTTIAVSHRLSTIQKADLIYVLDQGRIVEQGTHFELIKRNGRYKELVELQNMDKS